MAGRAATATTLKRHLKRLPSTTTSGSMILPIPPFHAVRSEPTRFTSIRSCANSSGNSRPYIGHHLLDGFARSFPRVDFQHWFVAMSMPHEGASEEEILDYFIKTLAKVVGSEEEAKKRIYEVNCDPKKGQLGFGCKVGWDASADIEELPGVHYAFMAANPDPNWEFKGWPQPERPLVVTFREEKINERGEEGKTR